MRLLVDKFKTSRLFTKIFIVMVVSIIAVSTLTSGITIRMSVDLFTKTFSITNSKVINQIETNLEAFHDSVITASNRVLQSGAIKRFLTEADSDSLTMAKTYYSISQQMEKIQSIVDTYEVGITITGINGRKYSTDLSFLPLSMDTPEYKDITRKAHAEPKRLMYQYYYSQSKDTDRNERLIIATKALMNRSTSEIYGTLYITIRERDFKQFYTSFTSGGNDVYMLDKSGVIVSSNKAEHIGTTAPDLLGYAVKLTSGQATDLNAKVMDRDSVVLAEYMPFYDYYLINVIDKELALSQMMNTKAIVMTCIVIVLASLIIVFLLSRQMTKSLTLLVKQMSNITKNHLDSYITVSGSYETRELGHAFNYMLDELHDYVDKLVASQKEQRNAELAALQQQINPHFLYNTLASIKFLVQQGSKEKASETINALIVMLQNTIGDVSETVTIEQELVNLKSYVFINHVRYGERIRVNYFVDPSCMQYHVPKLIIQPFIENAFFHAFNRKNEGTIHILVSKENDSLLCEIADNGDGMELDGTSTDPLRPGMPNHKSKRQLFSGIGINNVHDRIGLLYGDEYGITITSKVGEGTRISIRLPLVSL